MTSIAAKSGSEYRIVQQSSGSEELTKRVVHTAWPSYESTEVRPTNEPARQRTPALGCKHSRSVVETSCGRHAGAQLGHAKGSALNEETRDEPAPDGAARAAVAEGIAESRRDGWKETEHGE